MKRLRRFLIPWTFALGLVWGAEGHAQNTSPPGAARVSAARRALEAGGSVDAMVAAMRANLPAQRAATPQPPDEFWKRFEARMIQDLPQLVDSIAVLYARTFTQEELEGLTAFYGSSLGRRLRDVQPSLVTESTAIGQRWGMRIGAEIGASLRPR